MHIVVTRLQRRGSEDPFSRFQPVTPPPPLCAINSDPAARDTSAHHHLSFHNYYGTHTITPGIQGGSFTSSPSREGSITADHSGVRQGIKRHDRHSLLVPEWPCHPVDSPGVEDWVAAKQRCSGSTSSTNIKTTPRAPRRAKSIHAYLFSTSTAVDGGQGHPPSPGTPYAQVFSPEESSRTEAAAPPRETCAGKEKARQRPRSGAPRRSYSVTDFEPLPTPSTTLTLQDLPSELHMAIFDWLDPIDSTCLGLANSHFYAIHRRMHGRVSLSARRQGPNDMERAWYLAARMVDAGTPNPTRPDATAGRGNNNGLACLRVRGQALCRKCGVYRCELHKHLEEWMGRGYEYCALREKFGPAAPPGAQQHCYRSNPNNPHRCGRHRVPKPRVAGQGQLQ